LYVSFKTGLYRSDQYFHKIEIQKSGVDKKGIHLKEMRFFKITPRKHDVELAVFKQKPFAPLKTNLVRTFNGERYLNTAHLGGHNRIHEWVSLPQTKDAMRDWMAGHPHHKPLMTMKYHRWVHPALVLKTTMWVHEDFANAYTQWISQQLK